MESNLIVKNAKPAMTPVKDSHKSQSKVRETPKSSENSNPNLSIPRSSPAKHMASPHTKSGISRTKSASKNHNSSPNPPVFSPRNKIRERKFVIAKKKKHQESVPAVDCKCGAKQKGNVNKCLCVAYETLRASQEEFFKNKNEVEGNKDLDCAIEKECTEVFEDADDVYGLGDQNPDVETGDSGLNGNSSTKRRREKMLEEARQSVPVSGKVMHLVHAFEKLTCLPFSKQTQNREEGQTEEGNPSSAIAATKPVKWELPGMRPEAETQQVSSSFHSSLRSSDLVLTAANLGLDPRASVSSSWDSSRSRVSSTTSNGGRRRRRNSLDSSGTTASRRWQKKQLKVTSQKPFTLRTEQRGRMKEEEFMKKLQEMMIEEEKMRVPIAQGLPWTTDEPECLIKPPVKEITRPIDLKLYSDLRAEERAEFDHQVAEKMSLIEQYKMERERQQKLAEEEEIRRLRKELVPKAQPMPYFDRPFIPRRSMKNPTIPREPKLHMPDHKKFKCCSSWSDTSSYISQEHY